MSRLDLVYGFRRIPAKCRFGASLGRGRAFRRTAVTSARKPCACRTLAASGRSGGLDDLRANAGLSRRRSRVRVPSLPLRPTRMSGRFAVRYTAKALLRRPGVGGVDRALEDAPSSWRVGRVPTPQACVGLSEEAVAGSRRVDP